jgi:hypothetical protein
MVSFCKIIVHPIDALGRVFGGGQPNLAKLNTQFLRAYKGGDTAGKDKIISDIRDRLVASRKLPALLNDLGKCDSKMIAMVFSGLKYFDRDVQEFLRKLMNHIEEIGFSGGPECRAMLANIAAYDMGGKGFKPDSIAAFALCKLLGKNILPIQFEENIKRFGKNLSQNDLETIVLHEPSEAMFDLLCPLMNIEKFRDPKAIASYIVRSLKVDPNTVTESNIGNTIAMLERLGDRKYELGEMKYQGYLLRMAVIEEMSDINQGLAGEVLERSMVNGSGPQAPDKKV